MYGKVKPSITCDEDTDTLENFTHLCSVLMNYGESIHESLGILLRVVLACGGMD